MRETGPLNPTPNTIRNYNYSLPIIATATLTNDHSSTQQTLAPACSVIQAACLGLRKDLYDKLKRNHSS